MYRKKLDEDIRCPLEYGIGLIGGKWKSRIVCLIGNVGPMRFGELKSDLVNISDGVLASDLNELILSDLIEKESTEHARAAEYRITEKGKSLLPILQELCKWSAPYYRSNNGIVMGHCKQCDFYKHWSEEIDDQNIM